MVLRWGKSVKVVGPATLGVALALLFSSCDWVMFGYDAAHSHFTPDNAIDKTNVSKLQQLLITPTAGIGKSGFDSSPAVANGVAYVGTDFDNFLYAYDAKGVTNCSGTPNQCNPLWTGTTAAPIEAAPAVAYGFVFVVSSDGSLSAFDASGVTNCSGTPKVCQPLWTAKANAGQSSSPMLANGVVYTGGSTIEGFDAKGVTNCSGTPKVCLPLWQSTPIVSNFALDYSSPAFANGVLYASGEDDKLYAFSTTNCTGAAVVCNPLWIATMGQTTSDSSPAVSNGVVYDESNDGELFAFNANGVTNCSGTPTTCGPLWTAALTGAANNSSPAVANGVVYAASSTLQAFDANGVTNCSGTPKTCTPLWSYQVGVMDSSPSVTAGGLVYIGSFSGSQGGNSFGVMAFDANGVTNCSGTPEVCNPLWTGVTATPVLSSPAIANGEVYAGDSLPLFNSIGFNFYAWGLP